MRRGLIDGIVWMAVGVTLMAHAGIIAALGWLAGQPVAGANEPSTTGVGMLRGLVAGAFVCVGVGAVYLGYRRFRSEEPAA